MFENLSDRFERSFKILKGQGKITEINIAESLKDVRRALLDADVNYKIAKQFTDTVKQKALGQNVLNAVKPSEMMVKIVHDELAQLMGGENEGINLKGSPCVILISGLQGSGKTTTAAKLAKLLKSKGRRPYLIPADVYRPAAIDQLQVLGASIGVDVHPSEVSQNPVSICRNGVIAAAEKNLDTLIIDTAGRLHIDSELMEELRQIKTLVEPAEILFVADAMTGQDAVTVAEKFKNDLDLTGVVLTKMEGDARGGAALSIKKVTGRPIKFVGVGEGLEDLDVFHPDRLASRILGMGDVLSLIEKAEAVVDQKQAEELARKIKKNEFTLEDFRDQIQQIKKMGSLEQIMGMIPGLNKMKQMQNVPKPDESELGRTEAIINSMTPVERRNYQIINASRRQRIASGSGTQVQDVNRVIKSYSQMLKMMRKMKGFPGGMTGGKKRRKLPKGLRR
ncbi:MAG: signal recognition particle protein [Desulfobacterales bacterium]|nr:signal recognition particle protein [Desulfobacterales bacterium]